MGRMLIFSSDLWLTIKVASKIGQYFYTRKMANSKVSYVYVPASMFTDSDL